jgi:ankyrin repeat protein
LQSTDYKIALAFACRNGDVNLVKELINKGAQINLPDEDGITPLMIACKFGNLNIVKLLSLQ